MRRLIVAIVLFVLAGPLAAQEVKLPNKDGSLKFAVLGDTGTGGSDQVAVGKRLAAFRDKFKFDFALLLGDNLYGGESPRDYNRKFEVPYKMLLDGGVKFYAALVNHDDPNQRNYKQFNMNGERYYTFKPSPASNVRFFALDSNYMDPKQLEWFEKELAGSGSDWKIAFFHHPPYASGQHGSDEILRGHLEPLFIKHGVNVVLTGHEHFYERIKPQKGVQYFVMGNSAKLRQGDIAPTGLTAVGYDEGYGFMLVEIDGDNMHFAALNQQGKTVDSGVVRKSTTDNRVISTSGKPGPGAETGPAKPAPAAPAPRPSQPQAPPSQPKR
jgi:calcineurin-like phosphoesterase family protein